MTGGAPGGATWSFSGQRRHPDPRRGSWQGRCQVTVSKRVDASLAVQRCHIYGGRRSFLLLGVRFLDSSAPNRMRAVNAGHRPLHAVELAPTPMIRSREHMTSVWAFLPFYAKQLRAKKKKLPLFTTNNNLNLAQEPKITSGIFYMHPGRRLKYSW